MGVPPKFEKRGANNGTTEKEGPAKTRGKEKSRENTGRWV